MKKLSFLFLAILVLIALVFLSYRAGRNIGYARGFDSAEENHLYLEKANAVLDLRSFIDISNEIRHGTYGEAQCSIDLLASQRLDEIQSCIESEGCKGGDCRGFE